MGDPDSGFFAIYDGHGGKEAADIASAELHKFLEAELLSGKNSSVEECFIKAYESMDLRLKFDAVYMGATAVTCLIRAESGRKKLYVANAGDARAVLCRGGKAERLTYDHKASDAAEQARVQECGGFVSMNRVQGVLAVSRSLGDHAMKQSVISKPHFWQDELLETDTFAIVACDGLWDVCTDQVKPLCFNLEIFCLCNSVRCGRKRLSLFWAIRTHKPWLRYAPATPSCIARNFGRGRSADR
jgi:protein phosphatase PTC1